MESYVKVPVLELSQHHGILIHRQYWEYFCSFVVEHYMDTSKARIGVSNMCIQLVWYQKFTKEHYECYEHFKISIFLQWVQKQSFYY